MCLCMYIINNDQKTEQFWMGILNGGGVEWCPHSTSPFKIPIQLQFITCTYWFAFAWMNLQLKRGGLGREFICLIHINSDSSTSVAEDFLHLYLSFLTLFASVRMLFFCLPHETTVLFETSYFLATHQSAMPPSRSWHAATFSWMVLVL